MDASEPAAALADRVADAARALGFERIGFCPAAPFVEGRERLERWLDGGLNGEMVYLTGDDRADPRTLLPAAKTLIVVALPYPAPTVGLRKSSHGDVAAYARGADYHSVVRDKLWALSRTLSELVGRPVVSRVCVDTAPLLEREAAARSGVGFIGKSTMLIAPGLGTNAMLGELLVDVEITPTEPIAPGCGSCEACLVACPTGAFVSPHVLDARRCISYLTIEFRGFIPRELRPAIGLRIFGCDECQAVCPYNASDRPRPSAPELAGRVPAEGLDLVEVLSMGNGAYRRLVKNTALRRISRNLFARNAAVALGNAGDPSAAPALERALLTHPSELVRGHAAWALGRLGRGAEYLEHAAVCDPDEIVREEARLAAAST